MKNVYGFSSNQLVFGSNPNLPNNMDSRLPDHEGKTSSEIVAKNLNAMHSAWKALIKSESNEQIRQALCHQTRTSGDTKYLTSDMVFYKRNDNNREWRGPGSVIGHDGQQVQVKHGSPYICFLLCRLTLDNSSKQFQYDDLSNQINDHGNILSNAKNNVAYRSIDVIDNSESEHNNTDEEPIDIYENGTERDDADNLTNPINKLSIENSENIESTEEGDKEISDVIHNGSKFKKIKAFAKYQPSGSEHWKQVQIMSRGGKTTGKYQSYLNTRNLENRTT